MIRINEEWMLSPRTMRCFHFTGAYFDFKETKSGIKFITAFEKRFRFKRGSTGQWAFVPNKLRQQVTEAYMSYKAEKELLA